MKHLESHQNTSKIDRSDSIYTRHVSVALCELVQAAHTFMTPFQVDFWQFARPKTL
jgi:hypothetical protein